MTERRKQLLRAMPVLDCADFGKSIPFYKEKLGFDVATWGEPVSFAIVQRGTVTLALAAAERPAVSRNWAAYAYVADVDALYAELIGHGVAIAEPPETRPYNCRESVVDDPDGHMIAFGQLLDPDPLGPGLSERTGRDASEKPAP
jgi:uncharacterized glyoxalase superfamily protein PhnB